MRRHIAKWAACAGTAGLAATLALGSSAQAADKKFKMFLSMSYIGNDWQAEAANMVKAMAAHKDFADKVDLQVQVAGPNAQRQIQQINAMVQQGAQAIVVYPISPTALNSAVKNACDKGVMIIAYDARDHRALRLQRHYRPGGGRARHGGMAGQEARTARATSSSSPACPALPSTPLRTKAAKEVFAKYPDIKIVAEAVGMWSQAVARTELSKILATHNWDQIDGLWMQVGCYTANTMQIEAGKKPDQLKPCAGEGSNGGRIQMLPAGTQVEGANGTYAPMGAPRISYASPPYSGALCAEARGREARRQGRPEGDHPAAADRHQRDDQILQGRHMGGDEGGLQRLPAVAGAESRLVRLDLLA